MPVSKIMITLGIAFLLNVIPASAATGRLSFFYQQLEVAPEQEVQNIMKTFPPEEWYDFSTMTPADEIPILAKELNSSRPLIRQVAAQQLWGAAMAWSANSAALEQLRSLAPQVSEHFNDPDPIPLHGVSTWKTVVMSFIGAVGATPSPELSKQMTAALDDSNLVQRAAEVLARTKPLPTPLLETLISKMRTDYYLRAVITTALGNARVNTPEAIQAITAGLRFESAVPDPQHVQRDAVRQSAARALGEINEPRLATMNALRDVLRDPNESSATKEQAQSTLDHLEVARK